MSTEAEQNRLIIANSHLVEAIAATFRGRKGIPFEDLTQEGMRALCQAARQWTGGIFGPFQRYALKYIEGELRQFVAKWQQFERLDENSEENYERIYEWQIWGILPSEGWTHLSSTPEDIRETYERFAHKQAAVDAAMISLAPRERRMVEAHFMREPRVTIAQLARDHKVSYYAAVEILRDAVERMRNVVAKQRLAAV